jgi:hypothetical protein
LTFRKNQELLSTIYVSDYEKLDRYIFGRLLSWGSGVAGKLGDASNITKCTPTPITTNTCTWIQVSAGFDHTSVIKCDFTLWSFGCGEFGRLGNNSTTARSSPVQVTGGGRWKQVSAGNEHTAAIKSDGSLWLWGGAQFGVLGDNTIVDKSSPVQTVSATFNWKQVSAGQSHTAAIKTDGTLWTWGSGASGRLGDNCNLNRSSPVQVAGANLNWKQVSAGGVHTLAIKTDGTLWTWGGNGGGQLGDGTTSCRNSPGVIVSSPKWRQVSAGFIYSAGVKYDGTLWTWGCGTDGVLGTFSTISSSTPVQTAAGGICWKQVSASNGVGSRFMAAVKIDGSLWAWGSNFCGQLGDDTSTAKSSPVQLTASGTWKQVSAGNAHAAATTRTCV